MPGGAQIRTRLLNKSQTLRTMMRRQQTTTRTRQACGSYCCLDCYNVPAFAAAVTAAAAAASARARMNMKPLHHVQISCAT